MPTMQTLQGKLLVAMPGLVEPTFAQSVIFLCAHTRDGAMGLIINKLIPDTTFLELAENLDLSRTPPARREELGTLPLHMGGPVEQQRGFVLHESSYQSHDGTLDVTGGFGLTATIDVLQDIAEDTGPEQYLLALGYAGWSPGQLENEIKHNGWLHCDADPKIVFESDTASKYRLAMEKIGIDPMMLSAAAGHG